MELSRHFIENWKVRVGGVPTAGAVKKILYESVRVQKGRDIIQAGGGRFRIPAIYWHPARRLFIKLDSIKNVAITVMTERCI
jgi:hypothetical protein